MFTQDPSPMKHSTNCNCWFTAFCRFFNQCIFGWSVPIVQDIQHYNTEVWNNIVYKDKLDVRGVCLLAWSSLGLLPLLWSKLSPGTTQPPQTPWQSNLDRTSLKSPTPDSRFLFSSESLFQRDCSNLQIMILIEIVIMIFIITKNLDVTLLSFLLVCQIFEGFDSI